MKQPWLAIFALLVLIGLTSVGDVRGYPIRNYPDPDQCTIYPQGEGCVGVPTVTGTPGWSYICAEILDQYGDPVPYCLVEIILNDTVHESCECDEPMWAVTDEYGWVCVPTMFGGTQIEDEEPGSAYVLADSYYLIGWYPVRRSPDFDGVEGNCRVELVDFTYFNSAYLVGAT